MYLIIRHSNQMLSEAVLLSAGPRCMRLVFRGRGDTVEYRLSYGQWVSEDNVPIELESLVVDGNTDIDAVFSRFGTRTLAAGGEHSIRD
jgi:hypothetical protein